MKYKHYFDLTVANHFESDIEDFDDALNAWAAQITRGKLRGALLDTDEGVQSIWEGIVHSDTEAQEAL
jgi:hypothetical protein